MLPGWLQREVNLSKKSAAIDAMMQHYEFGIMNYFGILQHTLSNGSLTRFLHSDIVFPIIMRASVACAFILSLP